MASTQHSLLLQPADVSSHFWSLRSATPSGICRGGRALPVLPIQGTAHALLLSYVGRT